MVMRPDDMSKSIDAAGTETFQTVEEVIGRATLRATNARLPSNEVDGMVARIREVAADPSKLGEYFPGGWINKALKEVLHLEE